MIQVNRIYLIFNRLVTKKFLVDTSDEEYKTLCAANTLLRLPDNLNLETVRNVASRYNLGDEFTQRWYAWHAMEFVQS